MNGILNVLKPPGMTSFDVVAYLRGVLKTKKIGHAGTLDPGAAGVLPICAGTATKALEYMMEKDKTYRAEMILGVSTDTQDSSGRIIKAGDVSLPEMDINAAIKGFIGKYEQVPPMYSAVRVDGVKLYELARAGVTVERKSRQVEIYSINIINIQQVHFQVPDLSRPPVSAYRVLMDVECSKGTYIRTLCSDIGDSLECGAHMSFLIRTKAGAFDIDSALTLENIAELSANGRISEVLIKTDRLFMDLNKAELEDMDEKRFRNGMWIALPMDLFRKNELVRVYGSTGDFLALGEVAAAKGKLLLKPKKFF